MEEAGGRGGRWEGREGRGGEGKGGGLAAWAACGETKQQVLLR